MIQNIIIAGIRIQKFPGTKWTPYKQDPTNTVSDIIFIFYTYEQSEIQQKCSCHSYVQIWYSTNQISQYLNVETRVNCVDPPQYNRYREYCDMESGLQSTEIIFHRSDTYMNYQSRRTETAKWNTWSEIQKSHILKHIDQ